MTLLRNLKLSSLRTMRRAGLFTLMRRSDRRRERLLILCFHGVSLDDEHEWAPGFYISPAQFERRMETLQRGRYNVVTLGEGIERLRAGTLPECSVVITFDDGMHDFHRRALPVLEKYRFPATVYLTTYYCLNNWPIFRLICSYMLWRQRKCGAVRIEMAGLEGEFDLGRESERRRAVVGLDRFAKSERLSGADKNALARHLAEVLGIDFQVLCQNRVLHMMNPEEVRQASAAGIDFEYHTHRHRTPMDQDLFRREMRDNEDVIVELTGRKPQHFCYPSGVCRPAFQPWLEELGIISATTCVPGMARSGANRFALPRLLDHTSLSDIEYEGWLDGVGDLLPGRRYQFESADEEIPEN